MLDPAVDGYIEGDATVWEQEPLERLAADGQIGSYVHRGFWLAMDTVRDHSEMQALWDSGAPPWRTWD